MLELGPGRRQAARSTTPQRSAPTSVRVAVIWSRSRPRDGQEAPEGLRRREPARRIRRRLGPARRPRARRAGARAEADPLRPRRRSRRGPRAAGGKTGTCKPDPKVYRRSCGARGALLGHLRRREPGRRRAPRVKRWSIWNEPNQPRLADAAVRAQARAPSRPPRSSTARCARSAIAGLRATGHGRDQILLGETAPIGARRSGSLRASGRSSPLDVPARRVLPDAERQAADAAPRRRQHGCASYKKLAVTGFAHHPYTRGGSRPPPRAPRRGRDHDLVAVAPARGCSTRPARTGRIPRRLPIYYTEYGWQTNPPDRIFGVRVGLSRPQYINQSDWIAYERLAGAHGGAVQARRRGVAGELPVRAAVARRARRSRPTPPTGCRSGSAGAGARLPVYGQVRPADNGTPQVVQIQQRRAQGRAVQDRPDGHGALALTASSLTRVRKKGGVWRLAWNGVLSREARVARR